MSIGKRVSVLLVAAAVLALTACGVDRSQDITCGEFLEMSSGQQVQVVELVLEEMGEESTAESRQQVKALVTNTCGGASERMVWFGDES